MPRPDPQRPASWNVNRILWAAMLASTFVYLVVIFMVAPPDGEPPEQTTPLMFAFIALGTAIVSVVMPRVMFKKSISMLELPTRDVADPNASVMLRGEAPKLRVYEDLNLARQAVITRFFTPFILGLALSQAVVIYGLVLRLHGFSPAASLPFVVVGCALTLLRFPRESAVMRQAEEITGVRLLEPMG